MNELSKEIKRVLIIDDQATIRTALRLLLHQQSELLTTAEVSHISEANSFPLKEFDAVVANLHLSELSNPMPELARLARRVPILLLVGREDLETAFRTLGAAMQAGVKGIVFREDPPETLGQALAQVIAGETWFEASMLARVLGKIVSVNHAQKSDPVSARLQRLTAREHEIVAYVGKGLKNKQIARQLSLSEATVRHYLTTIFQKLEVPDRVSLAILAHRQGLFPPKEDLS